MAWFKLFDDGRENARAKTTALYFWLGVLNLGAWVWAWTVFAHSPALLGTAFLAYLLGLRHAVDADHIAAIDNVVRKLMQEGRRPISVGFFFSLGHSTIVVLASAFLAAAIGLSHDHLESIKAIGGVLGTAVSAFFLVGIGLANLFVLKNIWRAFQREQRGESCNSEELDGLLWDRGFLSRVFKPILNRVSESRHMYPVGFLFGLGFDTATEIGLLAIAASQAAQGLSFGTTMVFPILFTAGMSLVDTSDSVLMTGVYGWAFVHPLRKLWYNLTLTSLSVLVALLIGSLEGLGLVADKLNLHGGAFSLIESLNDDLTNFGFVVVGVFVMGWLLSVLIYRMQGFEKTEA